MPPWPDGMSTETKSREAVREYRTPRQPKRFEKRRNVVLGVTSLVRSLDLGVAGTWSLCCLYQSRCISRAAGPGGCPRFEYSPTPTPGLRRDRPIALRHARSPSAPSRRYARRRSTGFRAPGLPSSVRRPIHPPEYNCKRQLQRSVCQSCVAQQINWPRR